MRRIVTPLVVAALLFAAGAAAWMLGAAEERIAVQKTRLSTFDYVAAQLDIDDESGAVNDTENGGSRALFYATRMPAVGSALTAAATGGRATARYWTRQFGDLALERDAGGALIERDPAILLLEANAAFRASGLESADRETALDSLEAIIRNYADVLKSSPTEEAQIDAAYNYELAVRMRTTLERAKGATLPPKPAAERPPTIHGKPGGPPKGVEADQFRVVIPKRSDERSTDPEGGEGGDRVRKG
jgi:hypothetical protein